MMHLYSQRIRRAPYTGNKAELTIAATFGDMQASTYVYEDAALSIRHVFERHSLASGNVLDATFRWRP
jgi:hypothetical protein